MKSRIGNINRETKETQVSVTVNLDGNGKISVKTGINFLDPPNNKSWKTFNA